MTERDSFPCSAGTGRDPIAMAGQKKGHSDQTEVSLKDLLILVVTLDKSKPIWANNIQNSVRPPQVIL